MRIKFDDFYHYFLYTSQVQLLCGKLYCRPGICFFGGVKSAEARLAFAVFDGQHSQLYCTLPPLEVQMIFSDMDGSYLVISGHSLDDLVLFKIICLP